MKKVVIAIEGIYMANQLALADFSGMIDTELGEVEYVIHRNPLAKISPRTGLVTNYDILIRNPDPTEPVEHNDFHQFLEPWRVWVNERPHKSSCRHLTNQYGIKNLPEFIPVKTWSTTDGILSGQAGGFGNDLEGVIVLKHEYGSRGMGQVVFDTKDYSPKEVLSAFISYQKAYNDKVSDAELTDEEHIEIIKQTIPKVRIGYDTSVGVMETINSIVDGPLFIEEFVEGVTAEYRILIGPTKKVVVPRSIEVVDGYPQAIGSTGGMKETLPEFHAVQGYVTQAVDMLREIGLVYASADLFVTGEGWGLFEYANQYGANGIHSKHTREIQEDLLQYLITRYLRAAS